MRFTLSGSVRTLLAAIVSIGLAATVSAAPINIGFVSWDVTFPGNTGEADIFNLSGTNSTLDPSAPSTTPVSLSSLALKVDFSDGSTINYGSSYLTLASDGLSFDGDAIPIGGSTLSRRKRP